MRDIVLLVVIAALLAVSLRRPFVALLLWAWFTIMTPHQLAYGVYGIPLNMVIAGVTILGYVISGEIARMRFDPITVLLVVFAGWITLAQAFSLEPGNSAEYHDRFLKTLLFIILCAQMATTKLRIHALVWVLVAGIGFFAAKGALFTGMTLGQYRVQGLPNTILEDNNHFGMATATILPLIFYLSSQVKSKWLKYGLLGLLSLCIFAIIGTHSRGAFVSLAAFGGLFWLRSRHKVTIIAAMIVLLAPAIAFMPAKWTERMTTITAATEDASFMGRIDAWVVSTKLANAHPVTGAGLRNSYLSDVAASVDPERAPRARAAHSIYFEILGGTGYLGLLIYLSLFAAAFAATANILFVKKRADLPQWQSDLARAIQNSLLVFMIGAASVSMEMWDGYLMLIALSSAMAVIAKRYQADLPRTQRKKPWHRETTALPRVPLTRPG